MKIEVRDNEIVIKEVYAETILETFEGNQLIICMRDDTFEICVAPAKSVPGRAQYHWHRVDMDRCEIFKKTIYNASLEIAAENARGPDDDG